MGAFHGADTEQLRDLAQRFELESRRLQQRGDTIGSVIAAASWVGVDATSFRQAVGHLLTFQAVLCSDLRNRGLELEQHATEQDTVSLGDAAPAGTKPENTLIEGRAFAAAAHGPGLPARAFGMSAPVQAVPGSAPVLPEDEWPPPSAAGRDQRDLMDTFLPVGQNLHADQTSSEASTVTSTTRFGDTAGEFSGVQVIGFAEYSTRTSTIGEGYELPDGTTVWVTQTTFTATDSVGVGAEADARGFGLEGEYSRAVFDGTSTYQEVTVPPGVDLPPDFNPHDVMTYPPGVQVRFDDAWVTGTESAVAVEGTYRGLGLGFGHTRGSTEEQGESVIYERLDDGGVRVTQGPTEGIVEARGYSASLSGAGMSVGIDLSGSDHSRSYRYESTAFDLESEGGIDAYEAFRRSGELPGAETAGTSERTSVLVETQWREDAAGLTFSLGGGHDGASSSSGSEIALRNNTTGFDSSIIVDYHEDDSSRTLLTSSENPSSGVYAATETWTEPDGSQDVERYLSIPITEDVVTGEESMPAQIERDHGTSVDVGDRVEIHYTDEELDQLWTAQEAYLLTPESPDSRDDILPIVQRQNTAENGSYLLEHLRGLELVNQGAHMDPESIDGVPGSLTVRPD